MTTLLISLPVHQPELEEKALWSYEMVLAILRSAPWMKCSKPSLNDLVQAPFIRYHRPVVINEAIHHLSSEVGFTPRTVMENDEPDAIRELVKLGIGFAMLAYWSVAEDEHKKHLRVLRPKNRLFFDYGVAHRRGSYRPQALIELVEQADHWQNWWPLTKFVTRVSTAP